MRKRSLQGAVLVAASSWGLMNCGAQQTQGTASELRALKAEMATIELRITALEKAEQEKTVAGGNLPVVAAEAAAPPADSVDAANRAAATGPEAVKQAADAGMDTMDAGMGGETMSIPHLPELKIRGFGDVRAFVANQNLGVVESTPGSPIPPSQSGDSTFALGLMDLFVTSRITDHFSYLSEIGFEAGGATNGIGVDLERAQITYARNENFSVSAGRTHAMLGYYNTAFHHGTWFQTTIDRPRMFEFEDSGGPLPIHNVGVSAMGKIPSERLGLHWFGEVGNGKQTYSIISTVTPANVLADHTGKSTNVGMFARPDKINGLQTGFNWYQGTLVPVVALLPGYGMPNFAFPNAVSNYHQNIYIAHVVYIQPRFEFLVEDAEVRDVPRGSAKPLYTSGGYAQLSKAFGDFRPYFRYQWMNPNFKDPNNAWVGRWVGPSAGVRWDMNPFVALKLEYSNFDWKNFSQDANANQVLPIEHKTIQLLGTQITYTF